MMRTRPSALWPLTIAGATLLTVAGAASGEVIQARLIGYEETPAVSSPGSGSFTARIDRSGTQIEYTLQYDGLQGRPFMAHIHFGQRRVAGGISVWLCGNPEDGGTGPMGTPRCPVPGGTVSGVINAASVIGPAGQLIAPTELSELIDAIRAGVTYANVHTTAASGGVPGGEIRGQIRGRDNDHGHDH
ncbi:MAG TPA: CHRD domain-containing protein [Burkholderiaceae bacterium]|nr:CHRD domain-containing protein [Burkholderiaceae bacterium]